MKIADYFHRMKKSHSLKKEWGKTLCRPRGKKAFILGTPDHSNLGDSAIVLAEIFFLEKHGFSRECIKEITAQEFETGRRGIVECIRSSQKSVVALHGGGNFGDLWLHEEYLRRSVLDSLAEKKIVIFPQTAFFSDSEQGRVEKETSKAYYNKPSITIIAREKTSYDLMREMCPQADVKLTPDIVLSTTVEDYGVVPEERSGILFCARSDVEKMVDASVWQQIETEAVKYGRAVRRTDTVVESPVTKQTRLEHVRMKMQEFCSAELVVTDRLHGMVFAALTGTPCIVFGNNHHKVRGTYEWLSYLPYICFAENCGEALEMLPVLLQMKDCRYDNAPLLPYYEKIAEVLKNARN